MDARNRIEQALETAVNRAAGSEAPPKLSEAVRHAVFPGGARVRPRLCLAVAKACGDDTPDASNAAAAACELLHCASLVHDDLPAFDDAEIRRGKPSVHRAFGEPIAVLAGDALIVLAFETLARGAACAPHRLPALTMIVSRAVGMPSGITAGQAWESEPVADLQVYQRAKTGALFIGSAMAGAAAAGADPDDWRLLGDRLGEAYQVADDVRDAIADTEEMGKPAGQDSAHDRPNAVARLGLSAAVDRLEGLVAGAIAAIPSCPGEDDLRALVMAEAQRLTPKSLAQFAA